MSSFFIRKMLSLTYIMTLNTCMWNRNQYSFHIRALNTVYAVSIYMCSHFFTSSTTEYTAEKPHRNQYSFHIRAYTVNNHL